jgi:hypothetical protein
VQRSITKVQPACQHLGEQLLNPLANRADSVLATGRPPGSGTPQRAQPIQLTALRHECALRPEPR